MRILPKKLTTIPVMVKGRDDPLCPPDTNMCRFPDCGCLSQQQKDSITHYTVMMVPASDYFAKNHDANGSEVA